VHSLATQSAGWLPFAGEVAEAGCLVGFALICCIQYGYHLYYVAQVTKTAKRRESEFIQLAAEREDLERDRFLVRIENQILREFATASDVQKACRSLLKYFAPNPSRHFAAWLRLEESRLVTEESRGLSKTSRSDWQLLASDLAIPGDEEFLYLKGRELRQSDLWLRLSPEDRRKTEEVFFFPLTMGGQISGGFITTGLYPGTASRSDQLGLAQRIISGIGGTLKQRLALKSKAHELRYTEELLQLRTLTDESFASTSDMVQRYVSTVQSMLNADGAILFLKSSEIEAPWRIMVRCHSGWNERQWSLWEEQAKRLLGEINPERELFAFDASALKALGIDTLMRSAMLVPLHQNQQLSGVFCFARRVEMGFDAGLGQLAIWASEHLGKTLVRLQSLADMKRLARQDGLTDLANRRSFDERLDREIRVAQRANMPCSLLLCDLDHFKRINDTHGHPAGDAVLRTIARILQQSALKTAAGERALTARYGGEELAIILPGQDEDMAERIAEEIRRAVCKEEIWWQRIPIRVSISIGAATFPAHGTSVKDLIASADQALYRAKEQGRNRVAFPALLAEAAIAR
jgi:diguanylate cyclase (GGDEF)-like protein